jgi:hypothetical protein
MGIPAFLCSGEGGRAGTELPSPDPEWFLPGQDPTVHNISDPDLWPDAKTRKEKSKKICCE